LVIGAIPKRGEVRDVLVSPQKYTLATLPKNARVGTSSLRRAAQVLAQRPDVRITPLRGNVNTRIEKVLDAQYEGIILAGVGLERLGLTEYISQWLALDAMLPAPGQGALAVQCRSDDRQTLSLLEAIDDASSRAAVAAERQFLTHLGGGCAVPVGAFGRLEGKDDHTLKLDGMVASLDGSRIIRVSGTDAHPVKLGRRLAEKALSEGAGDILEGFVAAPK
jgi:hydroxymethylbilane synthase